MKLRHEQHCNSTWNEFKLNSTIGLIFNWRKMKWKLVEKVIQNLLMNMVLEKSTYKRHKFLKTTFHASSF
jgi:hypothetical protein